MMRWLTALALAAVLAAAAALWALSAPSTLAEADLPDHAPDVANGERMFWAGGCASCHATPDQDEPTLLGGGHALETPFGTFRAPNVSPDPDAGIGGWTTLDFVNAMARGVSPEGAHYYPAFPYTSYRNMRLEDVIDLKAYMDTLEPVATRPDGHDLAFPYSIRRGVGLWKLRYLDRAPPEAAADAGEAVARGAYLVAGPAHCGECHTPRDAFGGLQIDRWMAGGPSPEGDGRIPNITPHEDGIADWSTGDVAYSLETGFTPEFDSFGGSMARVVRSTARLPAEDREAIAAYLATLAPLPDAP